MNHTNSISDATVQPRQIFTFLVGYRWLSLIPSLFVLLVQSERPLLPALLIGTASNLIITVRSEQLNKALQSNPWLLFVDLLLMAGIISFSGQWGTAFFLYALNPLLIAAFYFGMRGAFWATTISLPLYGLMLFISGNWGATLNWVWGLTAIIGAYLISGTFGFASNLVSKLHTAQTELTQTHSDLTLLHDLTLALQQTADVEAMQEIVLEAITSKLGFQRAVMGLVDEETAVLTGWVGRLRSGSILTTKELSHPTQVPLSPAGGLVAQAVMEQRINQAAEGPCTVDNFLNSHFGMKGCRIFPMHLAERPIGVLLVDARQGPDIEKRLLLLESVAGQSAVAIGSMITRLQRARQTAVHEERIRFAQDLHDTVSQALFGIVFTLDGSLKLLPDQPDIVIPELERALVSAKTVRSEIRQTILDIWPTTLTAERFTADLRHYANQVIHFNGTQLTFDIRGDFASLSPLARRSLYRISQEALNNIATHAQAESARVCVDVENGRAQLVIRDDGCGFPLKTILNRPTNHDHFGLPGMQKRAQTLGGECHIFSQPGAGTSIVVDIPV